MPIDHEVVIALEVAAPGGCSSTNPSAFTSLCRRFPFPSAASACTLERVFDSGRDLSMVSDDDLSARLREASAEVNRAEVHRLAVAAEWDRRQAWANDGAYNGRCWLAHECTLSQGEAYRVPRAAHGRGAGGRAGGGGGGG